MKLSRRTNCPEGLSRVLYIHLANNNCASDNVAVWFRLNAGEGEPAIIPA